MKKVVLLHFVVFSLLTFMACNSEKDTNTSTEMPEAPEVSAESEPPTTDTWSGSYENETITLELTGPDAEGKVTFEISQGSEKCAELAEGNAYLVEDGKAEYLAEDSDCKLQFMFNNGTIEVAEINCSDLHGAACATYDGTYTTSH